MYPAPFKTRSRAIAVLSIIILIASWLPGAVFPARAAAGDITRLSISSSGEQANAYSRDADISADGRFVVFWSGASNLVAGDTNEKEDLFVRDRQTGETTRVSVSSIGAQADESSYYPSISGDGRFVAFMSDATNLVSGDTNGFGDVFLHDRQTGATTRVSISSSGAQANGISDSYVSISENGRFIAFHSEAANLVSGDANGVADVFVHDRQAGITERISLDSNEIQANGGSFNPSISADGRFVAFASNATDLVSGDTNSSTDVFVRDRALGVTTRVSVNSSGVEADRGGREPAISGNGRYVAFTSLATNLMDVEPYGYGHIFVHDRQTGTTTLVSTSAGWQLVGTSSAPDLSADGRFITFEFEDRGDGLAFWAILLHDQLTGVTEQISGPGGGEDDSSFGPAISADGSLVAFSSFNSRLVPDDTNGWNDIFLRELALPIPATLGVQSTGTYDGWVIESGEDDETGIRIDERATTFFLGDASNDQQYRSVLYFSTGPLPNNAILTSVTLKIKRQGIVGTNPFTTHGNVLLDIRAPYFDTAIDLQPADFQAPADRTAVGTMENAPAASWYTVTLDAAAFPFINLTGPTQLRLRFALGDNDDNDPDYMRFYSGDADPADRPVLTIGYFLPSTDSPYVVDISRADPDPTIASSVGFIVAFSEPVTGVDAADFQLTTSDGISGTSISNVSGSGDTYVVTVLTGTGSGTVRLDLVDDGSIRNAMNARLAAPGTSNGSFDSGESYTVNRSIDADTTGVFRPSNGLLYLKNSNTTGFADVEINYGIGGDYPVVGDWDGDGDVTIGIYRNGSFYLRNSNTIGFADVVFPFGTPGDQPVAGDWDGDGIDTIGVYRNGMFMLRNTNESGNPDMIFGLGVPGDIGITGDWDGNGTDSTGVFRPSNGLLYLKHKNETGFADIEINYGIGGDHPVTGDWNGDGIDTIGVYRNAQFYLRNSNTIGFADLVFALGIPGDHPIAGNWDGLP